MFWISVTGPGGTFRIIYVSLKKISQIWEKSKERSRSGQLWGWTTRGNWTPNHLHLTQFIGRVWSQSGEKCSSCNSVIKRTCHRGQVSLLKDAEDYFITEVISRNKSWFLNSFWRAWFVHKSSRLLKWLTYLMKMFLIA